MVILFAITFGLNAAQRIAPQALVEKMIPTGVLIFAGTGVIGLVMGKNFLDYSVLAARLRPWSRAWNIHGGSRRAGDRVRHHDRTVLRFRGARTLMSALTSFIGHYNYIITIFLMMSGLYIVVARGNLVKKLVGLSIFQTSVYLLYIGPGKILGGTAPIIDAAFSVYSNPLPHVLILTAIVVGVATLALGLALVVRINEAYGTIEEVEILERDRET